MARTGQHRFAGRLRPESAKPRGLFSLGIVLGLRRHTIEKAAQDTGHFLASPFRAIGNFFSNLVEELKQKFAELLSLAIKWAAIESSRLSRLR